MVKDGEDLQGLQIKSLKNVGFLEGINLYYSLFIITVSIVYTGILTWT